MYNSKYNIMFDSVDLISRSGSVLMDVDLVTDPDLDYKIKYNGIKYEK